MRTTVALLVWIFSGLCIPLNGEADTILSKSGTIPVSVMEKLAKTTSSPGASSTARILNKNNVLFRVSFAEASSGWLVFDSLPGFKEGMAIWRYKPWNAWTKPVPVSSPGQLPDWDVQFFYWQCEDGIYGAALPLCDKGYRTTLGSRDGKFGAFAESYADNAQKKDVALLVVGFDSDPYRLFESVYREGMRVIGQSENLVSRKTFPEALDYLGWCSFNALDMGKNLDERNIVRAVESFSNSGVPFRWIIVEDGYEDRTGDMLNSFRADTVRFPSGFAAMNRKLKEQFGLRDIGIWHAFNGYWSGINPDSELGRTFKDELFSWKQKPRPTDDDSVAMAEYFFVPPDSKALDDFYMSRMSCHEREGFSFVKVDNQLVTERMARDNYPIGYLSRRMHEALNRAVSRHFGGAMINCMDMTVEACQYFGSSSVARCVEDYFPYENGGRGYELEKGGAAAHLLMALYNNLYFSQMVFTDMDMFESYNPDGWMHAIARAANNGPVYLTDKPERVRRDVILPLCCSDGKLLRPSTPLLPTQDCLFTGQKPEVFKAFSKNRNSALLLLFNMSDSDLVRGDYSVSDIPSFSDGMYVIYDYFAGAAREASAREIASVELRRMDYKLLHMIPREAVCTPIGLTDKYNSSGAIVSFRHTNRYAKVVVCDYGCFAAYSNRRPSQVEVDGVPQDFTYENRLIRTDIAATDIRREHCIKIYF